jgi:hypothetical protein
MVEEPRRRSRNGEALPWRCRWWGVGNEMYGPWQLGAAPFAAFVEVPEHAKRPSWREMHLFACVRVCVSLEMHGSWHIHLQTHMGWALFEDVSPCTLKCCVCGVCLFLRFAHAAACSVRGGDATRFA